MKSFLVRLMTAAVVLPGLAYLLFRDDPFYFSVLVPVASVMATHELFAMLRRRGYRPFAVPGYLLVLLVQVAVYLASRGPVLAAQPVAQVALVTLVVVVVLFTQLGRGHRETNLGDVFATMFAVFYVGWLGSFLIRLRCGPDGDRWVFFLLFATWIFDSGACAWGMSCGRTKLWREVSPKKTWEGVFGGMGTAVALVWIGVRLPEWWAWVPVLFPVAASLKFLLLLTVAVGAAAQLGDLLESMIKRTTRVKDSSAILPGHGGFLDKLDSFLLTAPLVYFAAAWVEGIIG